MSGLIGKKIGMTSVYSAEGKNIPCTVIEAGPCVVTQIKTVEKDTYDAVQIAYDEKSEKHTTSSLLGHFKKAGTTPKRKLAEFKGMPEVNLGDTLTVDLFSEEDWVGIIAQFFIETTTILLLTFLFSCPVSYLAAAQIMGSLRDMIGAVSIDLSALKLLLQYGIEILVVIVGVMIAAYPIFRLHPKEILSKMS